MLQTLLNKLKYGLKYLKVLAVSHQFQHTKNTAHTQQTYQSANWSLQRVDDEDIAKVLQQQFETGGYQHAEIHEV